MGIDVVLAVMIIVSFLVAMPLHEWAHVQMAFLLGDSSLRAEGRWTLRVQPHIDPVGMLMCVIMAFQSLSGLGWGRPVKPDPWKMKIGANAGVLLVACAGPVFSLVVGLVMALVIRFVSPFLIVNTYTYFVLKLLVVFGSVNIGLALFNIIPLYPLDGYQILYTLLPSKQAVQFARSATYGPFIILIIFFFLPFIGQLLPALGALPIFHLAVVINNLSLDVLQLATPRLDVFGAYYFGYHELAFRPVWW